MGPLNRPYGQTLNWRERGQLRLMDTRAQASARRLVWHDRVTVGVGGLFVHSRYQQGSAAEIAVTPLDEHVPPTRPGSWRCSSKAFEPPEVSKQTWLRVQWCELSLDLSKARPFEATSPELEALGIPSDRRLNPLFSVPLHDKTLLVPALQLVEVIAWPSPLAGDCLLHPPCRPFVCALDAPAGEAALLINWKPARPRFTRREVIPYSTAAALAFWHDRSRIDLLNEHVTEPLHRGTPLSVPPVNGIFRLALDGYMCGDLVASQVLGYKDHEPCWPIDWSALTLYGLRQNLLGRYVPMPVLQAGSSR